jgi:hypothetical protein
MNSADPKAQFQRWANDARDALQRGRADLAQPALRELAARLPQHPAVLTMRRWAALIEFDWPAARGEATPAPRTLPAPQDIELVLFHADLPATAPSGVHGRTDYMAAAAQSFAAAKERAPRARRILLTDEDTRVPDGVGAHDVIRMPLDGNRLMYERMRLQERHLAVRPAGRATVFMDVDVATNRDPAEIFAQDFDIGLTWRAEFPEAPINGGLLFVGPGPRGQAFFREALRCYDALATDARIAPLFERDLRAWWGDQYALVLMVGYRQLAERIAGGMTVGDARVQFFSCDEYNFTPEPNARYENGFLDSRFFLHFKGNRKSMQAEYLKRIGAAANVTSPERR